MGTLDCREAEEKQAGQGETETGRSVVMVRAQDRAVHTEIGRFKSSPKGGSDKSCGHWGQALVMVSMVEQLPPAVLSVMCPLIP